jgi:glycine/sarcosine N-methyltransferase
MVNDPESLYDRLAENYHLIFADWNASIKRQASILGPILERECGPATSIRILDCACGIGTQLLGLAGRGFSLTGSDFSHASVERARKEAEIRGLQVQVFVAEMTNLSVIPQGAFDAVICMDNALPHFHSDDQLLEALLQIKSKLAPGRLFMGSIRNYDSLVREKPVVHQPTFYQDSAGRRIVHQLWDWIDDRHYTFHLFITREVGNGWESQHHCGTYRALLREELERLLKHAGFLNCCWLAPDETGFYQPIITARAP